MKENMTEMTIEALQNGQVTKEQYERLELFITHSPFATIRAKKALLYFLRESDYLKRTIVMTIPFIKDGTDEALFSKEVADAVHDMGGGYGSFPNLSDIFYLMGLSKHMSFHSGIAKKINNDQISFETGWDGKKQENVPIDYYGYTVSLSKVPYERNAELIEFDPKKIQETKLRKDTEIYAKMIHGHVEFYEEDTFPPEFHFYGRKTAK